MHNPPGPQKRSVGLDREALFPRMGSNMQYKIRPWVPSVMRWGAAVGIFATFVCEWKWVYQHVPILNYPWRHELKNVETK